ncbi:MAG: hypothetical protein KAT77_05350 [Nanoarchaeota archaeon]|nr:hypothetical protein [Nanoarchaeota archaeon]
MEINQIKEIAKDIARRKWYIVIERPGSPVIDWDGGTSSVNKYFSGALQSPFKINGFAFFQNKLMVDMKEHTRINKFLLQKYKTDKDYLKKLAVRMEKECDHIRNYADSLDKNDFNSIKLFFDRFYGMIAHFRWVYNAAEVLERIVKEAIEKPLKKNFISKYNIELNEIKKKIKEESIRKSDFDKIKEYPEIFEMINKFLKEFSWIKIFHFQGDCLSYDDFMEELKESLDIETKEQEESNIEEAIWILRYLIFLRTHIAESNAYAGAVLKPTLEKLAKKFGLTYEDITFMTHNEVKEMIDKKVMPITKEEIKDRRENGFACINLNDEYYFFSGRELKYLLAFYKEFAGEEKVETDFLKGTAANGGFVKGVAKVVTNVNEFHKLEKGDILIANSTTPNYMPIMGKAAAFLTDEGGITCHAAIVSREMGKPCIIGLKKATKVFNDGDMIEVDANKGIVRKI